MTRAGRTVATPFLSDDDFQAVRDYLLATAGLVFDRSRRASLAAVLADRLGASGTPAVADYLELVSSPAGADERQRLLDGVTVQETQFFRNAPQMAAMRREVLPELLSRTAGRRRPLTVWSAGCSTGEEPYTLAMQLLDLAPEVAAAGGVRIVGTDVSARALEVARQGTYAGRTLTLAPPETLAAWFDARPDGVLAVADPVRRLVDLRLHNLVTEPPPFVAGEVDLVVCRNVTIYFDRATTRALVASFHRVLAEGGYLLLGHSETLWQVSDGFTLVPVGDAFVYRRSPDTSHVVAGRRRGLTAARLRPAVAPVARVPSERVVAERALAERVLATAAARPAPSHPGSTSASIALSTAQTLLRAGDYPGAVAAADSALRGDPLLPAAYVLLGRAHTALGDDVAAVDPLRKAVYLAPGRGDAHFLLAGALARLGQHATAAASYRAAAASLGRLDAGTLDDLFGGRDLAELVDLCQRLADQSADLALGSRVGAGGVPS